jgi:hypothetical protein
MTRVENVRASHAVRDSSLTVVLRWA